AGRLICRPEFGDAHSAKKGSRKRRVPGGQRTPSFSGSDWTLEQIVLRAAPASTVFREISSHQHRGELLAAVIEADGRHPCQPNTPRGPRKKPVVASLSPVQAHPRG